MKILLIASIYPTEDHPDYGTFVRNIKQLYEANGHMVELIAYQRQGSKVNKLRNWLVFFRAIVQALDRPQDYDLINLHYPFLAAFPMAHSLKKMKRPFWVSLHGSDVFPDSRLKRWAIKPTTRLLEHADRIIVPSAYFMSKVARKYQIDQDKFRVIAPGGFSELFFPAIDPSPTQNIGFVGRFVSGKGWQVLLDAFRSILQEPEAKDYHLHLVGSGADRAVMIEQIEQSGLSERVSLHSSMTQARLAEFYRTLDFFVFPTQLEESLGMVAIEALASGVPVIASNIGAVNEYLQQGKNGYLVEPGNSNELAQAMLQLIRQDQAECLKMKRYASRSVERYRETSVRKALERLMEEELR